MGMNRRCSLAKRDVKDCAKAQGLEIITPFEHEMKGVS